MKHSILFAALTISIVVGVAGISVADAAVLESINFLPLAADPVTCNAAARGTVYVATSTWALKICNGTNFVAIDSDTDTNNYPTGISFSGTGTKTLTLTRNGLTNLTANFTDIDTDAQTLSFASPNISISGGNSVSIAGIDTDTNTQCDDIACTLSDETITSGSTIALNTSASTAEGGLRWDATNDLLMVGTGAATLTLYPPTSAGTNGQVWKSDGTGLGVWGTDNNTTYAAGTGVILSGTTFGIDTVTDDDITNRAPSSAGYGSGFYQTGTATLLEGWPEDATWYHLINVQHSNVANNYALQLAADYYQQQLFFRSTNNVGTQAWSTVWTSSSDGAGSGLDADLLDGQSGAYYLDNTDAQTLSFASPNISISGGNSVSIAGIDTDTDIYWTGTATNLVAATGRTSLGLGSLATLSAVGGSNITDNTIEEVDLEATNAPTDNYILSFDLATGGFTWVADSTGSGTITGVTAGNQLTGGGTSGTVTLNVSEGAGSGLDADLLDGISSASFLRSDTGNSVNAYTTQVTFPSNTIIESASAYQASLQVYQGTAGEDAFMQFHVGGDYALYFGLDGSTNDLAVGGWSMGANKYRVWHAGNDGAGSGLDADLLDGNSSAYFAPLASPSFTGDVTIGGDAIVSGNDLKFGGGAWVSGSGASVLQFLPNSAQDTAYEWVGFYSGATRQFIILWDAAWCTASATDVCLVAENSQRLVLQSGTTEVLINDATLTVGDGATSKINVGTVDPLYTIGGKRYATYMAGMTGVKEETTGVVKLTDGEYALDLVGSEEGSDLWLFGHAINVNGRAYISHSGEVRKTSSTELFDKMSVLVTPGFKGEVWYEKDAEGKRVIIHGSKDGEVSYRLTAPRFDASDWGNRADSEHKGFNLDELLQEN